MSPVAKIEAVLFATGKPMPVRKLADLLNVSREVVMESLAALKERLNTDESGIHLIEIEDKVQLVSNPACAETISQVVKDEFAGELTRPSLEALTIIAYRAPITKPEIEQIRGVNCSLILRNLLMRGLIEERDDAERLQPVYTLSADFVRHLGVHATSDLPDYEALHNDPKISELLGQLAARGDAPAAEV